MKKGSMYLYYNYELDELFLIKKGCLFGKYMLETYEGTSAPVKTIEEIEKMSNLFNEYVFIGEV